MSLDASLAPRRTRTVDLDLMTREELIELAKKLSKTNREKSQYIAHLEEIVKDITDRRSSDSVNHPDTTGPNMTTESEVLQTQASLLELQQEMEKERAAFSQEMNRSEELARVLRGELAETQKELQALREMKGVPFTPLGHTSIVQTEALEAAVRERVRELSELHQVESEKASSRINQLEGELQHLRVALDVAQQHAVICSCKQGSSDAEDTVDRNVLEKVELMQEPAPVVIEGEGKTTQDFLSGLFQHQDSGLPAPVSVQVSQLQQEVDRLRAQLTDAHRERDEALAGPVYGTAAYSSVAEQSPPWTDAVGSMLSRFDDLSATSSCSADEWPIEGQHKDEMFCKVIKAFRVSMAKLQSEVVNVASECVRLKRRIVELEGSRSYGAI